MTTRHETEIEVDPSVPIVRITREFDAPVDKVFRAHTEPELVAQWLCPRRCRRRDVGVLTQVAEEPGHEASGRTA